MKRSDLLRTNATALDMGQYLITLKDIIWLLGIMKN